MLRSILFFILSVFSVACYGQYILRTPDGKLVKLNTNGTWTFTKAGSIGKAEANPSLTTYTGKFSRFTLQYDVNHWKLVEDKDANDESRWQAYLTSNDQALSAFYTEFRLMLAVEDTEKYYTSMFGQMGEVQRFSQQDTVVNGLQVLSIKMDMIIYGLPYVYIGYVHNSEAGSYQLFLGTQKHIFVEDRDKIMSLMNSVKKVE